MQPTNELPDRLPAPRLAAARDSGRGLVRSTGGVAYVEFLLVFVVIYTMFLSIIQIALMYVAHVLVRHAAVVAARAAIVVLPDNNPALYGDAPLNTLLMGNANVAAFNNPLNAAVQELGGGTVLTLGAGGGSRYSNPNARMRAIHDAASIPLLALAPSSDLLSKRRGLVSVLGRNIDIRRSSLGGSYNRAAMSVVFPERPRSPVLVGSYGDRFASVTTRVTYAFACTVPIARGIPGFCKSPGDLQNDPRFSDLREAPESSGSLTQYAQNLGLRFVIISSEATMPLQGGGCIASPTQTCEQ